MRKPGERSAHTPARTVLEPAREHGRDPRPRSRTTALTALQRGAGNRAVTGLLSPSDGPAVQRFGSREHRQIGDTAAGAGQTTDEIIDADSTAARTDGGGASGGTHRNKD